MITQSADKCPSDLVFSEVHLDGSYSFIKCTHFEPCYLIWDVLAILYQLLHNFYSIYQGLKSSQDDENMMSCTRIYVKTTEA